ncbi:hypothetical protein ACMA5I_07720 [Paracoccaceae bacterium GXU_MW_L88]
MRRVGLTAIALAAAPVWGQVSPSVPPEQVVNVPDSLFGAQPLGRGTRTRLTFGQSAYVEDDGGEFGYGATTSLNLNLDRRTRTTEVGVSTGLSLVAEEDNDDDEFETSISEPNIRFYLTSALTPRLNSNASLSYRQRDYDTTVFNINIPDEDEVISPDDLIEAEDLSGKVRYLNGSAGLAYRLTPRDSVNMSVNVSDRSYDDDQAGTDYTNTSLSLGYSRAVSPTWSINLSGTGGLYEPEDDDDIKRASARIGASGQLSPTFAVDGAIGTDWSDDTDEFSLGGNLGATLTRARDRMRFSVSHAQDPDSDGELVETTRAGFDYNRSLTRRDSMSFGVNALWDDDSDKQNLTARYNHNFTPRARGNIGYLFQTESDDDDVHRLSAGFSWSFERQ